MLTRSNAGNERNFASALLSTNEISKCSTKLRNTQRNFETLNETSLENSLHQTKYRSKFRAMFRAITRNFEHVKTIALRNFVSFEISLVFAYIRRNSLLLFLHSTVQLKTILSGPQDSYKVMARLRIILACQESSRCLKDELLP